MPRTHELVGLSKSLPSLVEGGRTAERLQIYTDIARKIHLGLLVWRLDNPNEVRSLRLIDPNSAAEQALSFETEEPEILRQVALNGGTGDLHCVRERLRKLGGRLEINSDSLGTTVSAILPVSSEAL